MELKVFFMVCVHLLLNALATLFTYYFCNRYWSVSILLSLSIPSSSIHTGCMKSMWPIMIAELVGEQCTCSVIANLLNFVRKHGCREKKVSFPWYEIMRYE